MDNPWGQLPEQAPYVLPADATAVESFNRRARDNHILHTEKLPEPYLGDPTAPIVLLNLNGGSTIATTCSPRTRAAGRSNSATFATHPPRTPSTTSTHGSPASEARSGGLRASVR